MAGRQGLANLWETLYAFTSNTVQLVQQIIYPFYISIDPMEVKSAQFILCIFIESVFDIV